MNIVGINHGTSGNVSARMPSLPKDFFITPSAIPYDDLLPDMIARMNVNGAKISGGTPSTEWALHRAIYKTRQDVMAIVHSHPIHCMALACAHVEIPAFHYMVAVAGGGKIPLAKYATFGTEELAYNTVEALGNTYSACLMANHGLVAVGKSLDAALHLAEEVETLARTFILAKLLDPKILSPEEIARVLEKFRSYNSAR